MVVSSAMWINMFPPSNVISMIIDPRTLVTVSQVDNKKHFRIEFGSGVQTHKEHDNGMVPQTIRAISLRSRGNSQVGYYFISLNTGIRIHQHHCMNLSMTNEVIYCVHFFALISKVAVILTFGRLYGTKIVD